MTEVYQEAAERPSLEEFERVSLVVESIAQHICNAAEVGYERVLAVILADGFTCEKVLAPFYAEIVQEVGASGSCPKMLIADHDPFEQDTAHGCCAALAFGLCHIAIGGEDPPAKTWAAAHGTGLVPSSASTSG